MFHLSIFFKFVPCLPVGTDENRLIMDTTGLISQISSLPDNLKEEVADFVSFLQQKIKAKKEPGKIKERKFGYAKGSFEMAPDFDDPLDEFKDYM